MRSRASSTENQLARSTSGNCCIGPVFGGHSIEKVLLRISSAEQSPSSAHTVMTLPLGCLISSSEMNSPFGLRPVSSSNSRFAASRGSSPSAYSPLGIDQDPRSFFCQKGPPGCTKKTSTPELTRLNINNRSEEHTSEL